MNFISKFKPKSHSLFFKKKCQTTSSPCFVILFSFLVNPFQKIAGVYALVSGWIIICMMSYLGSVGKFYSVGVIGSLNASVVTHSHVQPTFLLIVYQNSVVWFVISVFFLVFSKMFQQKRLRIIDFFGTVALARFPFLILTTLLVIMCFINPSIMNVDFKKGLDLHPSLFMSVFGVGVVLCFIWEIVSYFYALKESSGLVGKKLWISFIVALVLSEIIVSPLTMIFV